MFPYDYGSEAPETLGTVYVVDDDDAVRDSLKWLLEASDYRVELYDSGESFIAKYDPKAIAVLVLDVRMPGMSGLEVQEHLLARKAELPIIFITGHGDVSMAVNALKRGAVDFIEKPFEQAALKQLVERMLREARERHMEKERRSLNEALLAKLTPREQQVLERIIHGRLNKQIADDLGISIKTVEAHRASIMDKTGSGTVADLMRVVVKSELYPKISSTLAEAVAALPSRLAETGLPHTEENAEHMRRLDTELREAEAERQRREEEATVTSINSSIGGPSSGLL